MIEQTEVTVGRLHIEFPDRIQDECSFGAPAGKGIRFGYAGWGMPDVILDPRLPLDMSVKRMGLQGKYKSVLSVRLINKVHGDCNLTHTINGLLSLLDKGGTLRIDFSNTSDMAEDAIRLLKKDNFVSCQCIEKFCFLPPDDESGLVYQQTFLNKSRVLRLLMRDGFSSEVSKESRVGILPLTTDDIRLDNISDEQWKAGDKNNLIQDSLSVDRPRCIICSRPATKMDHNRASFSRYCKDHYHEARKLYDKSVMSYYTTKIVVKREK